MGNVCCNAKENAGAVPVETTDATSSEPALVVTVVGARGLRNSDWLPGSGKPDCYCGVASAGKDLYTTRVIEDVLEPVWAEEFEVAEFADGAPLEFFVYDKDYVSTDFLGKAVLEAKDYAAVGFNGELKLADAGVDEAYIKVKVKVAGEELPQGPMAEFTATMERASKEDSFGIRFDVRDGINCQVLEMLSGAAVSAYNKSAPPGERVEVHDFISGVNGVSGSSQKIAEEFKASLKVECAVKRHVYMRVVYDRGEASEPTGLQFSTYPTADFLIITGADGKHNERAGEHEKLCPGDRIVSIGGVQCKPAELQAKLEEQSGKVQLVVMRPAAAHSEGGMERAVHWLFG